VHASVVLFVVLFALLVALGAAMGAHVRSPGSGVLLGMAVFAILGSVAWFQGSEIVLSLHGAREADPAEHRVLLNVVDEMRLAAGLPMPKVYVMDTEGMNAFAAGRDPGEAVVAVTTGLLSRLDRHELQAVVAHELGHVGGRDTLYAVLAAVLVGSVALLSDFFLRGAGWGLRGRRGSGRGGGGGAAILGLLLALLAPVAAKLLQMSISRQREYRADAASAAFTRNPLALASALGKISGDSADVPGANRGTQHLFIVNPLKEFTDASSELFSTHPPTARRIERLRAMAGGAAPR
jgi:heat shock protein HtpX